MPVYSKIFGISKIVSKFSTLIKLISLLNLLLSCTRLRCKNITKFCNNSNNWARKNSLVAKITDVNYGIPDGYKNNSRNAKICVFGQKTGILAPYIENICYFCLTKQETIWAECTLYFWRRFVYAFPAMWRGGNLMCRNTWKGQIF